MRRRGQWNRQDPDPGGEPQNVFGVGQLIKERKEEKQKALREKLQSKLKTIRDRRISGVNTEPFPEGAFERLKRNNIWDEVLGYLTEPSDVTSAYFGSRTFQEILEDRRKLMLLPQALNAFRCLENWESIFLNFRGVSKDFKEAVDSRLFDSNPNNEGNWFPFRNWNSDVPRVYLDEEGLARATSSLSSPSPGQTQAQEPSSIVRYVHVVFKRYARHHQERFYRKLMEFLKIHGPSVWFVLIDGLFSRNAVNFGDYEKICVMLKCMPNLKGFGLGSSDHFDPPNPTQQQIQNFRRRLNENPFPVLVSLEHFCCEVEIDGSLISQILRMCPNLRTVKIPGIEHFSSEINSALAALPLERFSLAWQGYADSVLLTTRHLNLSAWSLKYLELGFLKQRWNASVLFPALNRLRETLEYLEICETEIIMNRRGPNIQLDLPHLKSLGLPFLLLGSGKSRSLCFDDLLPLVSLKAVMVKGVGFEDASSKVKIKWYLYHEMMEKSNVWDLFPDLKICFVTQRGYFRRPTPS